MIEQLAANPTVATVITILLLAIGAFMKGTVVPGVACQKQREDFEAQARDLRDRIEDERNRADRWMEVGMRATGVATDLVSVAKSRDVTDVADRREREKRS